jgi:hypothetical protein
MRSIGKAPYPIINPKRVTLSVENDHAKSARIIRNVKWILIGIPIILPI